MSSITKSLSAKDALAYYRAESDPEMTTIINEHATSLTPEERVELMLYMICHMTGHLQHIMDHLDLDSDTDSLEQIAERARKN